MPLLPLESKHDRTTSGVACHLALGEHTRSDNVGCGKTSSSLDNTQRRTTSYVACHHPLWTTLKMSGMACHHYLWKLYTVRQSKASHAFMDHGNTHGHITSGVACYHRIGQHTRSHNIGNDMPSSPMGHNHGRTMFGMIYSYRPWTTYMVRRHLACDVIIDV